MDDMSLKTCSHLPPPAPRETLCQPQSPSRALSKWTWPRHGVNKATGNILTHNQQVNPRFYWSLKSLHPDPLLIHRFWFLILTPMFEITYVRAGGEDGSVFDKMFQCFHSVRLIWLVWILNYLSILCVSNILVWNHLCEGGRRQQKQRLVTLQLTSLKPDTWVDQLLSGHETDNLGGSLPV